MKAELDDRRLSYRFLLFPVKMTLEWQPRKINSPRFLPHVTLSIMWRSEVIAGHRLEAL